MKFKKNAAHIMVFSITILSLGGCGTTPYLSAQVVNQQYSNPAWAPPYVPGLRYYYLPDIEVYYDLSNQDFVYLDNGQWLFSSTLPSIYGAYDLYNGFIIALNVNVYQPWMHNQYYISHYPRYYYRNKYSDGDQVRVRGFNENSAKPFYRDQQDNPNRGDERQDNRNNTVINRNRPGNNRQGDNRPSNPQPGASRPPQKVGYYGKDIGRPVKVQPHMRENTKKAGTNSRGGNPTREQGRPGKGR